MQCHASAVPVMAGIQKTSRPLKGHLERSAEVDYSKFGIAAIILMNLLDLENVPYLGQ